MACVTAEPESANSKHVVKLTRGPFVKLEPHPLACSNPTDLPTVVASSIRPFVDAVRITVNTLNPLAAKLIDAENNPNRGLTAQFFNALQQLMLADVRRQLVEIALTSDALAEHPHDPEDSTSVAGVLLNQLALIFNGDDITSIRMRFMRDPVDITQWVHDATLRRFF